MNRSSSSPLVLLARRPPSLDSSSPALPKHEPADAVSPCTADEPVHAVPMTTAVLGRAWATV